MGRLTVESFWEGSFFHAIAAVLAAVQIVRRSASRTSYVSSFDAIIVGNAGLYKLLSSAKNDSFINKPLKILTMVNRILQPQELEVFYVIPAIRREFALRLKESGKPQKDIAKVIGVTEAAVSQYVSSKRAALVEFPKIVCDEINASVHRVDSSISFTREIQRLLKVTRDAKVICRLHEKLGTAPKGCNVCFEHEEKTKGPV